MHEKWKFTARSLKEACDTGEWQEVMGSRIEIKQVWGVLGLFWFLLLDGLEGKQLRCCGLCGRPIQGRQQKQFCGPNDDITCHRKKRAGDKARERALHAERQ